jgi:hypothetical protein
MVNLPQGKPAFAQARCGRALGYETRRAYASRVCGYLIWLDGTDVDADPLTQTHARDAAAR